MCYDRKGAKKDEHQIWSEHFFFLNNNYQLKKKQKQQQKKQTFLPFH